MTPRLYISGPITKGDRTHNFAQAATAQAKAMRLGFAVMNPMLSMMHPEAWTIPHEYWMANDLPWVESSDVVFRLPGESEGAERECEHAKKHSIQVIDNWDELVGWIEEWERS